PARLAGPAVFSSEFFFSSRRRHTRWPRDWSSDVCSSDLLDRVALLDLAPAPLQHLRSQRDDLHESLLPQLPRNRPEDPGPTRIHLIVDKNRSVLVEADVRPVRPPPLLPCANDNGFDDLTFLHRSTGQGVLHGRDDDV